ncbi:sodium- and chloride-dependent taurine transporter-like, partial [Magallana gigas]|uniref:sodium- and chloride-dependent taurine transporter-like n=1 Tax=Magallana gigas TaxID=29159 RepID=UPI003341902F
LAVCLLVMWILVYFCVWRGVKWSGKVVYFTVTFPYVILLILLVRGATLPGAGNGIKYFLSPDFSRLQDAQVWIDGGTQVFFSAAIAIGAMISLGSYNDFHTDFYKHTMIVAGINSGTSFLSGFAVFSVLGFMAHEQNVDIDQVAESGPGLVFIVYPKAVTMMPLPQLWAILFFLMLFLIGIDSGFVMVESVVAHISDMFPRQLYKTKGRMILTAVLCFLWYTMGLSMVSRGGMYVFQLYDYYSASGVVLLWVCFWESIVIGWVYDVQSKFKIQKYIYIFIGFKPLKYNNDYEYPPWSQGFGLMLALVSMCCIPFYVVGKILSLKGPLKERIKKAIVPKLTKDQISKKSRNKDGALLLQQIET